MSVSSKTILVCCLVFSMSGFVNAQNSSKQSDLAEMNLHGKIKWLHSTSFKAIEEDGKIFHNDEAESTTNTLFNENGNILETSTKRINNSSMAKSEYKYDNRGNRVEWDEFNSDGTLDYQWIYNYDEKNHKIEEKMEKDGKIMGRKLYKYEEGDKLSESSDYDPDGKLFSKNIYLYNQSGKLIESKYYREDGTLLSRNQTSYDENGDSTEENTTYDPSGKIESKSSRKYHKGKITAYIVFDKDGIVQVRSDWEYDENKNYVLFKTFKKKDNSTNIFTYKYDYDLNQNWVRSTAFKNEKPVFITERSFELF